MVSDSCNGMSNATFHAFMSYVLGDDIELLAWNLRATKYDLRMIPWG